MSSWRSSSFQPFPPPPPPPLACSVLRAACLAWTSASLSFCSWAFTSWTWRTRNVFVHLKEPCINQLRLIPLKRCGACVCGHIFTCFSTAVLPSSLEAEARISFRDCRLETKIRSHLFRSPFSNSTRRLGFHFWNLEDPEFSTSSQSNLVDLYLRDPSRQTVSVYIALRALSDPKRSSVALMYRNVRLQKF